MPELTLYYSPFCGYCRRVLNYIEENGINVSLKDVTADSETRQELIDIGGKSQVPCLVIDGQALYESLDIIEWFKKDRKKQ